ncbi:alpha-D-ribose 1-methylphosphonate 5-phosphate C-P-lyase PhnJ [Acidithiobacillus sp. CV18-2]|uniref:Alpha-D-ribose 1-methylphosphonate 5-phosphate C-P lyase n=1 Tax=Igneacidithiobacillus copahuensis TaxID=2724909 RepID=A0AAE2YRM5_9PROT|nr:alpha-D-ribose 1-methylphosphonate 5-phosphate C-P-lyase PhnJ [Igneacidithiobacillus copahuensis]MBU2755790.1 alpha-D-ribose 1-methylphosphonate 5-phosphate C-P-lyase PhnJ [Acidithiobacillus sp. CV18-3]MBU2757742.1 alpha-D-ribose 1-methylphosphonate 5-phosphate C-P-lyase PhnJ [Acidithiobacillus sp. BN09-2]MBU2777397.1 alpha-D-ribose 1-methylphosphonate 5-phosphate C-P-lyase PhnJ [Acidithiobacillus sp. CV18-2]MBU2796169.1 alpha-D-ribose 1-methylphosphonate 5-phosphate C-P-lyase PhnJ [Acidithi
MQVSYNFAYLDEGSKRAIRRKLLKAVAIPGHQISFPSRNLPLPYGWGTGGIQVTAAILGSDDILKVIDQGADDTTNAISIARFFARTAGVSRSTRSDESTIIQTRHRIPETPLREGQIMVYQVPMPEPLFKLEARQTETLRLHAWGDYSLMYLSLFDQVARQGRITVSYDYPVLVHGRYLMSPSPIPAFDLPKLHQSAALHLFGAGRERRLYAVPPYTNVEPLQFSDHPFCPEWEQPPCHRCGSTESYKDEIILDDAGRRQYVCSDTDYCQRRIEG